MIFTDRTDYNIYTNRNDKVYLNDLTNWIGYK